MTKPHEDTTPQTEGRYHTYVTQHIPWYVRGLWICFWVGAVWYVVKFAIPMAKNYF